MATPTWPQIIDVARDVVELYNRHGKSAWRESQKVAEELFGCSTAELALLTNALQDNACWLASSISK